MQTGTWRHLGACLLLGLFATFWGESLRVSECPMHRAAVLAAGHSGHGIAHNTRSPDSAPGNQHCQCLGDCLGGASVALIQPPVALVGAWVLRAARVAAVPAMNWRATEQMRLPFANAPPVSPA